MENTSTTIAIKPNQIVGHSELLDAGSILQNMLQLKNAQVIADLGAGGGMFSINAARLVGQQGQVYAVDVVKNYLSEIESKARMSGLYNIKTIWSNLEIIGAAKIPESSCDFAFIVNVLHQSTKQYEILAEAQRLLKPTGKLMIIDWGENAPPFAPPPQMKVSTARITEYAASLGLKQEQEFKAGNYHFGLIFIKQ